MKSVIERTHLGSSMSARIDWRVPCLVHSLEVGLCRQKRLHHGNIAIASCQDKGRVAIRVPCVHFSALLQQNSRCFLFPSQGTCMQRYSPVLQSRLEHGHNRGRAWFYIE